MHIIRNKFTENRKGVFCVPFICKYQKILRINIKCNLTKKCPIFVALTEPFRTNMGILYLENQYISPVHLRIIRSSICSMH